MHLHTYIHTGIRQLDPDGGGLHQVLDTLGVRLLSLSPNRIPVQGRLEAQERWRHSLTMAQRSVQVCRPSVQQVPDGGAWGTLALSCG
jgi:hypothetical protein